MKKPVGRRNELQRPTGFLMIGIQSDYRFGIWKGLFSNYCLSSF